MKTIDELVDELAVRLNSGQTVKQKTAAKPVSAPKPMEVKPEVKKECKKQCKCGGNCKHESPEKMTIAMGKNLPRQLKKRRRFWVLKWLLQFVTRVQILYFFTQWTKLHSKRSGVTG